MKVLVTGATGFVGRALVPQLQAQGHAVRRALRGAPAGADDVVIGDVGPDTRWDAALHGVDAVVHLAARAHILADRAADPEAAFMAVNAHGTRALAQAAARAGVAHFVFVSSIGVYGAQGHFDSASPPAPVSAYGRSKAAAEAELAAIASAGGMRVTIVRPPLVYGPGAPGNLELLMKAMMRGVPLPLRSIDNRRSLIGVDHLADALACVVAAPGEAVERWSVADAERVSTPELVSILAQGLGRPARLLAFPPALLRAAAALAGRKSTAQQLAGSLTLDGEGFAHRYGWRQRRPQAEGLREMARAFAGRGGTHES